MADSQPYIAVCSVCSVEFPAQCGVDYDIGTANIGQTCPNGHTDYLYLKHESALQVAQRIKVWWTDYRWWKPRKPASENELIAAIGFGYLGEFEGTTAETRKHKESYLAQYRNLFHQAMTALAESDDYIQVDGDGELLSSDSRWFGQKEHWGRLFQAKTAEWSAKIEAGEELQEVSRLIDSGWKLSEQIGIRLDVADDLQSGRLGRRSDIKVFGRNNNAENTKAGQHTDQSKPGKRTPREIIDDEQVLANSFWGWLIAGGLAHYFMGFGWIAGVLYFLGATAAIMSISAGIKKMRAIKAIDEEIESLQSANESLSVSLEDSASMMDDIAEEFGDDNPEIAAMARKIAEDARK